MPETQLCAGLSADELARITGVEVSTARRWRRGASLPAPAQRLLRLVLLGDLGAVSPAWAGWTINRLGELVSPESWRFAPGEVCSIPLLHGSIAAHCGRANAAEARLSYATQADWIDQRYVGPGEMSDGGERPAPRTVHYCDPSYLAPGIARRRARQR